MMKKNLLLICLLFFAFAFSVLNAEARNIEIPVYFITDREVKTSNSKIGLTNKRAREGKLSFGKIRVVVALPEKGQLLNEHKELGWRFTNVKPETICDLELLKAEDTEDFLKKHVKAPTMTNIYIHGFATTFPGDAKYMANLSRDLEQPIIAFSWASYGAIHQLPTAARDLRVLSLGADATYSWDLRRSEECSADFYNVLDSIKNPSKVRIIAHSMGNRLLYLALRKRYDILMGSTKVKIQRTKRPLSEIIARYKENGKWPDVANVFDRKNQESLVKRLDELERTKAIPRFAQMVMVSADLNLDDFQEYFVQFTSSAKKLVLFVNFEDSALGFSMVANNTPHRLGRELLGPVEKALLKTFVCEHLAIDPLGHQISANLLANIIKSDGCVAGPDIISERRMIMSNKCGYILLKKKS